METQLRVLAALLEQPDAYKRGLALSRSALVASDQFYYTLMRLEERGWVESAWDEHSNAALTQRIKRRCYRLTALGRLEAGCLMESNTAPALARRLEVAA